MLMRTFARRCKQAKNHITLKLIQAIAPPGKLFFLCNYLRLKFQILMYISGFLKFCEDLTAEGEKKYRVKYRKEPVKEWRSTKKRNVRSGTDC